LHIWAAAAVDVNISAMQFRSYFRDAGSYSDCLEFSIFSLYHPQMLPNLSPRGSYIKDVDTQYNFIHKLFEGVAQLT